MFRSALARVFRPSGPTLDNLVFRLHYRVTVGLLLACAVALLWKINLGSPLQCHSRDDLPGSIANDHCWYHGLFTIPKARDKRVGVEVPAPGIDVYEPGVDVAWHNMHRWVVIGVLVQAAFFYLPRVLWKVLEGRRVHRLMWNMNDGRVPGDRKVIRKQHIANYFRSPSFLNFLYVAFHLLCELLNLVNVVVQLFLVSHVLGLTFADLGVITESRSVRSDASATASFPLHTKCTMYRFCSSGDICRYDMMCLVTVNGVMETIFICQWIWFALLAVLSALALLYHVAVLLLPQIRALRLEAKTKLTGRATVENVTRKLGIGEWFLLYLLSKNLDPIHLRDILESLADGFVQKDEMQALSML